MRKRFGAIILIGALVLGAVPVTSYALTTQEKINQAEQEKSETEGKLSDTQDNIDSLENTQSGLQSELKNLNTQLTEVSDRLASLEDQISEKESQIETTQAELEDAQNTADAQYEAMKKRIQYMYESSDFMVLEMLLQAQSMGEYLNYLDYVEALSAYDRQMLEDYQATVALVTEKKAELEQEQADLATAKVEQEAEQSRVSGLVSSTANNIADYADQISDAEAQAEAYEAQLKEQESNIAALKAQLAQEIAMSQLAAQSAKRDISQVTFAEGDRYLLANLIYCEAGGEPYAGQLAVGAVVINRLLSSVYPDTITGVIYQRKQFSPVGSGRLELALAANKATASCYQAADEAMSGVSNVGDCVYFRTPIEGLTGIQIGGHIFY
ncbi:MAG: cell wall hydrolase [Lachnospiraceae bacterium]|nr:cell wall hydrolase [Lachnospiraceae bacterium]